MNTIQSQKVSSYRELSREEIDSTRIVGEGRAFAPDRIPNLFGGGAWGIGPFTIRWEIKGEKEVDVDVYLFGFRLADASGTLSADEATLVAEIDAIAIKGMLKITAQWTGADAGLTAEGDLAALGRHYHFKEKIVSW